MLTLQAGHNIEEKKGIMKKLWIPLVVLLAPVLAAHLVLAG